jgi:putative transposase
MKFRVVEELSVEQADVNRCCDVFGVSRSGYYGWLGRPLSLRKTEDQRLWEKIKQLWEDSRRTYGAPRIQRKLLDQGDRHGKKRVARIMRENGISAAGRKKRGVQTTNSRHSDPIAARVFKIEDAKTQVSAPNQFWAGDITYVPTDEGWLYLSVFLDLSVEGQSPVLSGSVDHESIPRTDVHPSDQ